MSKFVITGSPVLVYVLLGLNLTSKYHFNVSIAFLFAQSAFA